MRDGAGAWIGSVPREARPCGFRPTGARVGGARACLRAETIAPGAGCPPRVSVDTFAINRLLHLNPALRFHKIVLLIHPPALRKNTP